MGQCGVTRRPLPFVDVISVSVAMLSAETHAAFPGPHGAAYKTAVIRSGAHALLVGRLLRRMRSRAESRAAR